MEAADRRNRTTFIRHYLRRLDHYRSQIGRAVLEVGDMVDTNTPSSERQFLTWEADALLLHSSMTRNKPVLPIALERNRPFNAMKELVQIRVFTHASGHSLLNEIAQYLTTRHHLQLLTCYVIRPPISCGLVHCLQFVNFCTLYLHYFLSFVERDVAIESCPSVQ
ncbi:uncharacterized protein LOC125646533 [Ostrea edulis]|uniref:uncharacterized protein LOC125646533 n=1 Tax=Ostrea edulis TaxID=37623 RepID=UPI0020949EB9|nr:uncharacterized protein LOC125646533 [Ostrea edulis]